ncbi:BMC domain-containing protein [[Clostridium] dakarense]|uniref:BMC domain-containing protein n=1 Tax=Faecalimicrobium dakarense TaxID=1301100 RepID=UPI0004AEBE6A|nr:BMC domain-containing protein [[Clostridium] dakarense]
MSQNAIGMIETKGLIAAIEAADVMLKSANVEIVGNKYHKVRSGIIAVVVTGDVGAVKSAVESGSDAAKKIGKVLTVDVIARTDKSVLKMLIPQKDKKTKLEEKQEKINKKDIKKEKNKEDKIKEKQEEIKIEPSIQDNKVEKKQDEINKEDNIQKNKMEEKQEEIKIEDSTKEVKLEKNQKDIKKEDNKKSKDNSISKDKLENDDKVVKCKKSKK